jgi:hypothetical protein
MKRGAVLSMAVGPLCALGGTGRGHAQYASFGCKVLGCAAIPYCVPVMQALFRQLAKSGGGTVLQTCSGGDGGCTTTVRDPRSDPYYADIGTANGTQRFYFSLQGDLR